MSDDLNLYPHWARPYWRGTRPPESEDCAGSCPQPVAVAEEGARWHCTLSSLGAQARTVRWHLPSWKGRLCFVFPASLLSQRPQIDRTAPAPLDSQEKVTVLYIPIFRDGGWGGGLGNRTKKHRFGVSNFQWFSFVISEAPSDTSCSRFRCLLSKARVFVKTEWERSCPLTSSQLSALTANVVI